MPRGVAGIEIGKFSCANMMPRDTPDEAAARSVTERRFARAEAHRRIET